MPAPSSFNFEEDMGLSDALFLEQLANEHPRDITIKKEDAKGRIRITIDTVNAQMRDYLIYMLREHRRRKANLEEIYRSPDFDWHFEQDDCAAWGGPVS